MRTHRVRQGSDEGATAVEYGLIVVAIAAVIVAVAVLLGTLTHANYSTACTSWNAAENTTGQC